MIKLLVCDVDGTLLKAGQTAVEPEIIHKLAEIKDKKIKLAIASGRSYHSIHTLFSEVEDDVYFLCCDGSVCIHNGKVLYTKPLSSSDIFRVIRDDSYADCGIILSTPFLSYVIKGGEDFADTKNGLHTDIVKLAPQLYDIKEPIVRIAIYGTDKTPKPLAYSPKMLRVSYNSGLWCEYVSAIADKGLALSDLQMRLYLSKFDTMCIGDGENDVEMMKKAKLPVSVGDACDSLKNVCIMHTDDVCETLTKVINGEF